MSIAKPETDVHAEHLSNTQSANETQIIEAADENTACQGTDVSTNSVIPVSLQATELKELISFRALLETDRHKFTERGRYIKCCCPFHSDRTPSFFINEGDTHGKCYGCDWWGNIFDYEMEFHRVSFKEAWQRLNDFYRNAPRAGKKAKANPERIPKLFLSQEELAQRSKYSDRLIDETWLAEKICGERYRFTGEQWKPATIRRLAADGSLGWAGDALAFIYPTGTKYRRWPHKEFIWECHGASLWREARLADATHIYLTESETDAIALIDAGIEKTPGNAVIAVPGAHSFKKEWSEKFKGKVVTLCFDADDAGNNGADRTGALLGPYASTVLVFDMGRVK